MAVILMTDGAPWAKRLARWAGFGGLLVLLTPWLIACAPALDWRETRLGTRPTAAGVDLPVSTLQALFPCRPERVERVSMVAGMPTPSQMHVCKADGLTWAVTRFQLADASRMQQGLEALREALIGNAGGRASQVRPVAVMGMTPTQQAQRLLVMGRQADGTALLIDCAWAARGPELIQISVIRAGAAGTQSAAADSFFESVHW
jgi:hypothetical protein